LTSLYLDIKNIIKFPINGIDINFFRPIQNINDLRSRYSENIIILSVGALKIRKGQDILIKAFKIIKNKINNAKLLIIGSGTYKKLLEKIIINYGIEDVEFLGRIQDKMLLKYYNLCDIFILTPRFYKNKFEGFGLVYLEAGACKKPVIGARSGGVSEVIKHGETGFLVAENDYKKVAEYAIKILTNLELKEKLGENGLLNARNNSWSKICKRLLKLYYKILEI